VLNELLFVDGLDSLESQPNDHRLASSRCPRAADGPRP
jgi:hypothetical protein